jgi:hypothetical protein
MRQRTEQQLAEQHAFGAKIFGVSRLSRDLCVEVGSCIVFADQLVLRPVLTIAGLLDTLLDMSVPHPFRAAHQRGEDLVVVLAAAQIS